MPPKAFIDIDGSDAVSKVLLDLLNQFPGLSGQNRILFSTLSDASGIGFFPVSGAAIQKQKTDITGHVMQVCQYPFNVIYRAAPKSEMQRIRIKEFLDTLGKWLEKQPIELNSKEYQLDAYPVMASGNRIIKTISRTSPGYLNSAYQDGVEDWLIALRLDYNNEFDK